MQHRTLICGFVYAYFQGRWPCNVGGLSNGREVLEAPRSILAWPLPRMRTAN